RALTAPPILLFLRGTARARPSGLKFAQTPAIRSRGNGFGCGDAGTMQGTVYFRVINRRSGRGRSTARKQTVPDLRPELSTVRRNPAPAGCCPALPGRRA